MRGGVGEVSDKSTTPPLLKLPQRSEESTSSIYYLAPESPEMERVENTMDGIEANPQYRGQSSSDERIARLERLIAAQVENMTTAQTAQDERLDRLMRILESTAITPSR